MPILLTILSNVCWPRVGFSTTWTKPRLTVKGLTSSSLKSPIRTNPAFGCFVAIMSIASRRWSIKSLAVAALGGMVDGRDHYDRNWSRKSFGMKFQPYYFQVIGNDDVGKQVVGLATVLHTKQLPPPFTMRSRFHEHIVVLYWDTIIW